MNIEIGEGQLINCTVTPEIPDWAHANNPIIEHDISCGIIDPARIATPAVVHDREMAIWGSEYITRANDLRGRMNACAFDFYKKQENWRYLPNDARAIVFTGTVFQHASGTQYVMFLYRYGDDWKQWDQHCLALCGEFYSRHRVAVSIAA